MTRIIHLSDLHFGAHDERLVAAVEERIDEAKPDLVVISGDFTQRARKSQFEEACQFLERVRENGFEVLAVPGNHDVPLYDVLRRFISPLKRYRRYIDESLAPVHDLPGATVVGVNTARSLTIKDGRLNREQVEFIRASFATRPIVPRVLVTHHPLFALPVDDSGALGKAVGRQEMALEAVADAGVDILLAGHNHRASTHSARDLATRAGPALVIQAGTATSTRLRDEEQSFNRIDIDGHDVLLTVQTWQRDGFKSGDSQRFRQDGDHWRIVSENEAKTVA